MLDFGIAKLQQGSVADSVKTRTGTLMGTPIYMSPEQCRGTRTVDHRSDIYSLGVIFFEMLVGQPPFVSEGFGELVNMHLNVAPAPARSKRPEIPLALDAIVLKMLSKNPEDRFADMSELQAALKTSGTHQIVSSPDLVKTHAEGRCRSTQTSPMHDTTFSTGVGERVDHADGRRPRQDGRGRRDRRGGDRRRGCSGGRAASRPASTPEKVAVAMPPPTPVALPATLWRRSRPSRLPSPWWPRPCQR